MSIFDIFFAFSFLSPLEIIGAFSIAINVAVATAATPRYLLHKLEALRSRREAHRVHQMHRKLAKVSDPAKRIAMIRRANIRATSNAESAAYIRLNREFNSFPA
jgi:hypothetical protein